MSIASPLALQADTRTRREKVLAEQLVGDLQVAYFVIEAGTGSPRALQAVCAGEAICFFVVLLLPFFFGGGGGGGGLISTTIFGLPGFFSLN